MLTDTEKEKIRLEEIYRSELKQILSTKKEKGKSFIDFLGSSLGLWILSAIFLTFGAKLYEDYKTNKEDRRLTIEKIEKIDLEISYRFCHTLVDLYLLTEKNSGNQVLLPNVTKDSVNKIALSIQQRDINFSLYPEFNNYLLIGLMAEQKRLLQHIGEKDEQLDRVIEHITGLPVFYEVREVDFSNPKLIAGIIEEELLLPRWKKNNFYFFDGIKSSPFP